MARLLLLQPLRIYKRWPMPEDFTGLVSTVPTLAMPQIAGALQGHELDYMDGIARDHPLSELTARAHRADAVLINAHSSIGALNVEANVEHLLRMAPDLPIVLGGHHATLYAREWLQRGVHFVVRHEGEETIRELVDAIGRGGGYAEIAGLSWREGDSIHHNPDRSLIADLDDLPMPDWSILDPKLYGLPLAMAGHSTTVETSRGCSHTCSFCAATKMWHHTQRFKSAERVVEELRILQRMGYRRLWFADDNYGADPLRDLEIYERITREGIEVEWMAFIRADTIIENPDAIAAGARAGFRLAMVGYESPGERVLGDFHKGVSGEIYREVASILRRNRMFILGFFIVGYLDETDEETETVFRAARDLCDYPVISIFEPRRDTVDYGRSEGSGELPGGDMFYHNTVDFIPSKAHLLRRYRRFYSRYLLQPRQLRRLVIGPRSQRAFYRHLYANMTRSVLSATPAKMARPWEMVRDLAE